MSVQISKGDAAVIIDGNKLLQQLGIFKVVQQQQQDDGKQ